MVIITYTACSTGPQGQTANGDTTAIIVPGKQLYFEANYHQLFKLEIASRVSCQIEETLCTVPERHRTGMDSTGRTPTQQPKADAFNVSGAPAPVAQALLPARLT